MADIFISYSSNDRTQALQLTELLSSAGLSVWIDKHGIDVATTWSGEITKAITECRAFVVLLSPSSVASTNVSKEISLASERRKKILPLDLEPVELPDDIAYHLAGLQRAPMTNIDSIIRALGKLGLEATQAPTIKLVQERDSRKSLMILPFEDLSPTADNQWFADGIVSELIGALTKVKSLRLADTQATKEFRNYHGQLSTYAREMNIRYFVQGDVRKFGDQIKISSRLLDIETGDHLWQDALKGTMDDIFEIQEKVAEQVVEGLKIHLGDDEKRQIEERGTTNAEAYELFLRAMSYHSLRTKEGIHLAYSLYTEALALDPKYVRAFVNKAHALVDLFLTYERKESLLDEAQGYLDQALAIKPDMWFAYKALSAISMFRGDFEGAERLAKKYIQHAPDDPQSYFSLAFVYANSGQIAKAAAPYEESFKRAPNNWSLLHNLMATYSELNDEVKCREIALKAVPVYERHLKLFPDHLPVRVSYAVMLTNAGRPDDARRVVRSMDTVTDGAVLFTLAAVHCELDDYESAFASIRKCLEAGYRNVIGLRAFLSSARGLGGLKGTPQYDELDAAVRTMEAEEHTNHHG